MAFVLDCSITAVWALADENSRPAEQALDRLKEENAIVPQIWWYEIRNLLVVNERRKRLTADQSASFLAFLSALPIQIEAIEDNDTVLRFARDFGLSCYDAAYLSAAHRHSIPIATLDKALETAARAAGIALVS